MKEKRRVKNDIRAAVCGRAIEKEFSDHCVRIAFGTPLANGVLIENESGILGHTSIVMTQFT